MLNYLYAVLEAEATIAALSARLDPAIGLLHADRTERASMACDLMEPVRPAVDAYALSLFRDRVFRRDDVFELQDGHCRLLPPLARELAATAPVWAQQVRPSAEEVADVLRAATGARRRPAQTRRSSRRRSRGPTAVVRAFDDPALAGVGAQAPAWKAMPAFQQTIAGNRAWDREHAPADSEIYVSEILPRLRRVPLKRLCAATGLSTTMCSQFRTGKRVPHARHWEALRAIAHQP